MALLPTISCATAQAQDKPDWVKYYGTDDKYPPSKYITGFGVSSGRGSEALAIAQDNARANAAKVIVVDIKSLLRTFKEEVNKKYSQHLTSVTESATVLQLIALNASTYEEDRPPTVYALAYANKDLLKEAYLDKKLRKRAEIQRVLKDAQAAESRSENMLAATKYLSLYPLYEEMKEAETIYMVVGYPENASQEEKQKRLEALIAGLDKTLGSGDRLMTWTEVANRIDKLLAQQLNTVDEVARSLIIQLSKQVGEMNGKLMLVPFTYQSTKMTSSFARYLRDQIENQIGELLRLRWSVVAQTKGFKPKSNQITSDLAKASGAQWLLSGTYWEQGDKIKLMANLRELETGKMLAVADVTFDASILESTGLDPKPKNFYQALIEQNALLEGEIISSQIQVDVWTNKGNENLLFTEGETMKVYVRVNREAYIRLLYILADGARTVLYDRHYISADMANQIVEIPEEFECAPPFGSEFLVVVARTGKLPPLETVEVDGYYYLKADAPKEAIAQTRGMKRKKTLPEDVKQTEVKLVITTMEE
jgi:TolB-like protein